MSTPINWVGSWDGTTTYGVGDAVSYLGSSYIAVTSNMNVIPSSSEAAWNLLAAQGATGPSGAAGVAGASGSGVPRGLNWRGAYSALTAYNAYDCVSYSNSSYICTANGVLNKEPDNNPAYWGVLCVGNGEGGAGTISWGDIDGTLSNQTDLQAALDVKADASSLATVATSGSYADLTAKPTIPTETSQLANNSGFITVASVPTKTSELANDSAFITAADAPVQSVAGKTGVVTLTYDDVSGLSTVAHSGSYSDLSNAPTIPAAQVNSDWNASSGVTEILNKPSIPTVPTDVSAFTNDAEYLTPSSTVVADKVTGLATVATSGSYTDLSNKPTMGGDGTWGSITGALSAQTDLETALSAKANTSSLATVATSGSYTDLTSKPTIPTVPGDFTSSTAGLVPASAGGTANFLRADGTWAAPTPSTILLDVSVGNASGGDIVQTLGESFTVVTLPTVNTDTADGWDATTDTYTIPVTGDYLFVSKIRLTDGASSGVSYGQGVNTVVADGPYFAWFVSANVTSGVARNGSINTRIMRCNAGDRLQMFAYIDSGSGLTIANAGLNIVYLGS